VWVIELPMIHGLTINGKNRIRFCGICVVLFQQA